MEYRSEIIAYFEKLYGSVYVPLAYYEGDACVASFPRSDTAVDYAAAVHAQFTCDKTGIQWYVTSTGLTFLCICRMETSEMVILGPSSSSPPARRDMPQVLVDLSLPLECGESIWNDLVAMGPLTRDRLLCIASVAWCGMFGRMPTYEEVGEQLAAQPQIDEVSQSHALSLLAARETQLLHNTYDYEQLLYRAVELGQRENVEAMLQTHAPLRAGIIGETSLRQQQNVLLISLTLATQASIRGGLDVEEAYQLRDTYIMEGERAGSPDTVRQLLYASLIDFTEHVAAAQVPGDAPSFVYECAKYAKAHVNAPISASDVAKHVGLSRTYVSRRFKETMGVSLNSFISDCKLREGARLLAYTDRNIAQVSEYLCYSSQSYFQNQFKRHFGMTPREYREQAR